MTKKKNVAKRRKKKPEFVVRPWSLGPCPTGEQVVEAWRRRHESTRSFIWLLSVLGELVCYTDCNLQHLGGFGNIAGRKGGLKAWLAREALDLAGKYKSVSRHAALATLLKKAFNYYPPAPLSLLDLNLPLPKRFVPNLQYYALTLGDTYFRDLEPTYVAFKALADRQLAASKPKHRWGPSLPQEKWADAENNWRKHALRRIALASIKADKNWLGHDSC